MFVRLGAAWKAAVRSFRRSPGNAAALLVVLSAAAAASGIVESVWEQAVARPLPYETPERLVTVEVAAGVAGAAPGGAFAPPFGHEILLLRDESAAFSGMERWAGTRAILGSGESARTLRLARLGPGLLEMLGARPYAGRWFLPEEHEGGGPDASALLLSHDLWRTAFGGDTGVVGTQTTLDGAPVRIVGVMPDSFRFPDGSWDGWMPMPGPEPKPTFGSFTMSASPTVARLNEGQSLAAAREEAAALLENAGERPNPSVRLVSLEDAATAGIRPTLEILRVGAFLLLLAAAVSVVGLRGARALRERRSEAIRRSVGADRWDGAATAWFRAVVVAGGVFLLGSLLAHWLYPLVRYYAGGAGDALAEGMGEGIAVRGALLAAGAALVAEAPSFLAAVRSAPGVLLSRSTPRTPLAGVFLVLGTATASAMLIAAGVVSGSALRLLGGAHGYSDAGLAQVTVDFGAAGASPLPFAAQVEALDRLAERIEGMAGVSAVGYADTLPDERSGDAWLPSGVPPQPPGAGMYSGRRRAVSAGLFAALGMPVLRGRGFVETDRPGAEAVGALGRRAAAMSEHPDPLGRPEPSGSESVRVVGIVPEARMFGRAEAPATLYVPFAQRSSRVPLWKVEVVARFDAPLSAERLAALSRVPRAVDPAFRVLRTEAVRDRRIRALGSPVFGAFALVVFAAAGLLLAAVGAAGQVLETVARSERAVAIRRALGAPNRRVVGEVARKTGAVAVAGVGIGGFAGWVVVRFVGRRVLWVETGLPLLYAAPVALVLAVVGAACFLAAKRVVRPEPAVVLRTL